MLKCYHTTQKGVVHRVNFNIKLTFDLKWNFSYSSENQTFNLCTVNKD